jgi:aminoglycoside phosphotransferase (APT) family kinase protein
LRQLAVLGFTGAPTPLGFDEMRREVVSYIDGEVPQGPPYNLTDARLRSATHLIRAFHDASAGTSLADDRDVLCHSDLGPHNTVFDGEDAVGLIDWDGDVGPGSRAVDFAHAVWCFADVTEETVAVYEQARRIRVMCDNYGTFTPDQVVDELIARFTRAHTQHVSAGRPAAAIVFDELLSWMTTHGAQLRG